MKISNYIQKIHPMADTKLKPDRRTHDLSCFKWFRRPHNKIQCLFGKLQRLLLLESIRSRGAVPFRPGIKVNTLLMQIQIINEHINQKIMKTQLRFLRGLMTMMLYVLITAAWAQPFPNQGDETVCIAETHNYGVTNTPGSTYAWAIDGLTVSPNWTLNSNGLNTTTVTWLAAGVYTIQAIETNSSGCIGLPVTIQVTVTPLNTIALSSAIGTDNQTTCINTAITEITYATTGATGATFTGLPTGVTGSWAGNVVTITGTPSVSGTFNYTVTLTGGCGNISASGAVTVTPDNTITLKSAVGPDNQTVCTNTAITETTYVPTGATNASLYGMPAGFSGSWVGNVVTIICTPPASGVFNYTVTLTGGCGIVTANGTITVTPDNTITLTSSVGTDNQTVCINTAITDITYSTTGATGATFLGLPTGVTGNWAGNGITITGTPSVSGIFNYTVTLTGGCGNVTITGTMTVTPDNTIALTSAVGTDNQAVCINTAITDITYSTTGATGATFLGLPTGVTGNWAGNVATITGMPSVSGTFNYTVTLTGGCGNVDVNGTINVNPLPVTSQIFHD